MPAKIDLTGKVFHRLTVKKEAGRDRYGLAMWECECSCGATVVVRDRDLRTGNSKSCGCLNLEKATKKIQKQTVDHSNPASLASKKLSKKNTSGVRGVCPTKRGTWRATVGYKGKQIYLGEYAKKEDAVAARKKGEELYVAPIIEKSGRKESE